MDFSSGGEESHVPRKGYDKVVGSFFNLLGFFNFNLTPYVCVFSFFI
jgi:hypothetical protein